MNKEEILIPFTKKELIDTIDCLMTANYAHIEYTGEEDYWCLKLINRLDAIYKDLKCLTLQPNFV